MMQRQKNERPAVFCKDGHFLRNGTNIHQDILE